MSYINPTIPVSLDALAVGRSSTNPFITTFQTRDPGTTDVNWPVQQRWFNTNLNREWILLSLTVVAGVTTADWVQIASGTSTVQSLEGNSGGAVGPDGSNIIHVVGDGTTVDIVGSAAAHTLTVSTGSVVATSYVENSGTAVPSGGVLNVVGDGTTITTSGSGSTITITGMASIPTTFNEDSGSATPSSNTLNISGGTGIATSGSGNTVTIALTGAVSTRFNEDSGHAIPSAGVLEIVGGTGISTSGATNVVTITANGEEVTYTENSGTAQVSGGNLNILGTGTITTSGSGSTITINGDGATTYTANSGTASPSSNNINILGSGSVTTSGSGSTITVSVTGGGIVWNDITSVGPTSMLVNEGYVADSSSQVLLTLPSTAAFGSLIIVVAKGTGGFQIQQNAGQTIHNLSSSTTTGSTGTVTSNNQYGTIELLCITTNTTWQVIDSMGNFDFV
jgi:hypothetical protein